MLKSKNQAVEKSSVSMHKKLKLDNDIQESDSEDEESYESETSSVEEEKNVHEELIDEDIDKELEELKKNSANSTLFTEDKINDSKQFDKYFDHDLSEEELADLKHKYQTVGVVSWEDLYQVMLMKRQKKCDSKDISKPSCAPQKCIKNPQGKLDFTQSLGINKLLAQNWYKLKKKLVVKDKPSYGLAFTPLQNEIYTILNEYISLLFPSYDITENAEEIRQLYCLHALNHIFQGRSRVLKNNKNLAKLSEKELEQVDYRDQGIVRPKVVILSPFRDSAFKIIKIFLALLKTDKKFEVSYLKRFNEEFNLNHLENADVYGNPEEVNKNKPLDYQKTFAGDTDEHFRVGIALMHSAFRLYAPFYSSDIIIASPLGLRTIIGAKDESHYEHDFLASVEMLILDGADTFMMQNWEHVVHIVKHLHLQPKESHGVDFSRVRNSSLDGHTKHYCQTIVLSGISSPQILSLLTKYCFNYKGLAIVRNAFEKGTICTIPKAVPQLFHKLGVDSQPFSEVQNIRFKFFIEQILKQVKEKKMAHVLIYLPQYFDFVRLRNHMRREKKAASGPHFGYICEYTKPTEVGKARRRFLQSKFPILLYTERYHFYHRPHIKGIRHLIFYELPAFPQFYSELCNMVYMSAEDLTVASNSVVSLYSKYDITKLTSILGNNRTADLLKSEKPVHMFMTGNKV